MAYCLNSNCEYCDTAYEDNCGAPESVCNCCGDSEWSDEQDEQEVTIYQAAMPDQEEEG